MEVFAFKPFEVIDSSRAPSLGFYMNIVYAISGLVNVEDYSDLDVYVQTTKTNERFSDGVDMRFTRPFSRIPMTVIAFAIWKV